MSLSKQILINQLDPDARLVSLTAATTIVAELHAGKILLMEATAGVSYALPPAIGSGNIYHFVQNVVDSDDDTIDAVSGDVFKGVIIVTTAGTSIEAFVSTANDIITLNDTTQGGFAIGDWISLIDVASGVWAVTGLVSASGAESTPFSGS